MNIRIPSGFHVSPQQIERAGFAGEGYDWGALQLFADHMHQADVKGQGTSAVVLDTGYFKHPDLPDDIETRSFVKGEDHTDYSGHSTHVRGIMNMQENGTGLVGMAPKATVHLGKVLDRNGMGHPDNGTRGLRWAIREMDVDLINMSLAMPNADPAWEELLYEADEKGIIVVAASGNSSKDFTFFPASHPTVIGVNATNDKDQLAVFSNKGRANISAPGVGIRSAWIDGNYRRCDGTSMAAPYVSGMILLYLQWFKAKHNRKPSPIEVKTVMCAFAKDLGQPGEDLDYGCGRITNRWVGQPNPTNSLAQNKGCRFW